MFKAVLAPYQPVAHNYWFHLFLFSVKLSSSGTFTPCRVGEILGESLAVDAAGNIELGLRGNIVAVIGALTQLDSSYPAGANPSNTSMGYSLSLAYGRASTVYVGFCNLPIGIDFLLRRLR